MIFDVDAFAAAASRSNIANGTIESSRPWPSRIGHVRLGILLRLLNLYLSMKPGSESGKNVRAMSLALVNVLNANSPATRRRDARSIATAPPRDQPPE